LIGVKCLLPFLAHHNYFYPRDSGRHFIDLFEQKEWPGSPVIYVGNSSVSEPNRAAGGSNLCVMVQVPAGEPNGLSPAVRDGQTYRDQLVYLLEQVWGLEGLSENVEVEKWLGPADIEEITRATGGTLFGTAIHGWRSFARPPLRDKNISGLYYLGSAAYPVDSLSMSVLSGLHAAEMIEQDWVKEMQAKAVN
jgi:phytoene dehydrogenase-like protein